MTLKNTLKSVALAGLTFAAGLGAYRLTHNQTNTSSSKAPTHEQSGIETADSSNSASSITHDESPKGVARRGASASKSSSQRKVVRHQELSEDFYELRAGVLMPINGESQADYEARRARLEKQENELRVRMAKHYQERLASLRSQHANPMLIDAAMDRLEANQKPAVFISCYTAEGAKRLRVYNQNQRTQGASQQRDVYDF